MNQRISSSNTVTIAQRCHSALVAPQQAAAHFTPDNTAQACHSTGNLSAPVQEYTCGTEDNTIACQHASLPPDGAANLQQTPPGS
jgi:hypothetical protein